MTDQKWTPERIRELRGERSINEFAGALGVSDRIIRYWEREGVKPRGLSAKALDREAKRKK